MADVNGYRVLVKEKIADAGVDLLITHGTPGTRAAKQTTSTIPIVMAISGDAVATGLVSSLARPGANVTGSTFFLPELNAKRLEVLKEACPSISHPTALSNPDNPVSRPIIPATCPQTVLPKGRHPKKAVTNIASPRPRTQSGSATWAETLRLAKTAIHT